MGGRSDDDSDDDERISRKKRRNEESESEDSSDDNDRRKKKRKRKRRKKKKRRRKRYSSSSSSSDSEESQPQQQQQKKKVVNERLLAKLSARGETLEERKERRAQKRAAHITAKFGYTAEDNPFNDPNLHQTFTWKKREDHVKSNAQAQQPAAAQSSTFDEIEKVRKRRRDRELQLEEMERIRAEESRMKELENYDEWARKEEEFHLNQQRQRSAIRLVEGREQPIDVLAKNLLLFGLSEEEKQNRAAVAYKEKYNALEALGEATMAELDEPQKLLQQLKLEELQSLLGEIEAFCRLEREASGGPDYNLASNNHVLQYWDNLQTVTQDEIKLLKSGGKNGAHAKMARDISKIFKGQSTADLHKMLSEVTEKSQNHRDDRQYWMSVKEQLRVHLAKQQLSDLHSKMLVRQLEMLEKRKEELAKQKPSHKEEKQEEAATVSLPSNVEPGFGDLEEELGLTDEIDMKQGSYSWQDKYHPRKPRYFNRVKTGYDWNKYNQTHYDRDNPPPKIVQGYKFNIFYPDLIDPTKTPQFVLEPADADEFCILRFKAGPPYEDVAFKIINREWNRSRKRGFKCTFERGVLSLYFNFTTHWYRR